VQKVLKVLGILSLVFGGIAALLCIAPLGIKGMFFAVIIGFFGMMSSTAYIFIDFRYQLSEQKLSPGVIGILLSSLPVVIIIVSKFIHQ
jgi:hypothetical protein